MYRAIFTGISPPFRVVLCGHGSVFELDVSEVCDIF